MKKGQIYHWEDNYPPELEAVINRHYEVVAISLTHIYIRNLRLGHHKNVPIETFKRDYVINPMFIRKGGA